MGNTLTVRVTGVDTAALKFKYLINAARSGLKLAVPEAALLFEQEAKETVPVVSGNLRDHIHTEQIVDESDVQTLLVTPVTAAANEVGFDPPYARRVHDGFIGTDLLGRTYHQSANPFMDTAFENKRAEAAKVIKDGIIDALDEAVSLRR